MIEEAGLEGAGDALILLRGSNKYLRRLVLICTRQMYFFDLDFLFMVVLGGICKFAMELGVEATKGGCREYAKPSCYPERRG